MGIFDEDIEKGYASEIQIFFGSEFGFKDFAFPSMRMGLLPSLFCLKKLLSQLSLSNMACEHYFPCSEGSLQEQHGLD